METTDYCSYELSKALKSSGFDEPCHYHYDCDMGSHIIEPNCTINDGEGCQYITADDLLEDNNGWQYCSAPTLWQAQKWLRNKGIEVYVLLTDDNAGYEWGIYDRKGCDNIDSNLGDGYKTYEQALSAGIARAVELIKKGE